MANASNALWQPLLDSGLRNRALAVADEIGSELRTRAAALMQDGSLARGQAGVATTFAYLDKALPGKKYDEAAAFHLDAAMDCLAATPLQADLYGGFTGIAWAAAQINRLAGRSSAGSDEFSEIDDLLLEMLSSDSWTGHYDLISGLVGLGVYALERLPDPRARACLTRIVEHMDRWAEKRPEGVAWRTGAHLLPPSRSDARPEGEFNLGLAHGVPGAIALLGQASAVGTAGDIAARLVDQAVPWLLAQRLPEGLGASFGYEAESPERNCIASRSAWCYGDPGIAAALLCAARARGNAAWERDAIELVLGVANRPEPELGIDDAGLCHGWAGLLHLFNRMYQTTGDPRLAEPARKMCERTLAARQTDRGVSGYAAWLVRGHTGGEWRDEPGFLEGAAGVALALAAASTDVDPTWDSVLLISNTVVQ